MDSVVPCRLGTISEILFRNATRRVLAPIGRRRALLARAAGAPWKRDVRTGFCRASAASPILREEFSGVALGSSRGDGGRGGTGASEAGGTGSIALISVSEQTVEESLELLNGYDEAIAAVIEEIEACASGDAITFSTYVIEPGRSTQKLLGALRDAADRGVRLELQCDLSLTSHVTRVLERTSTEAPALAAIARQFPSLCSFVPQSIPTHAKYAIFRRAASHDSAIFGGVNVGDRFQRWRDFAVRLRGGGAVARLSAAVDTGPNAPACLECDDVYSALSPSLGTIFCCNKPRALDIFAWFTGGPFPGIFQVKASLVSLFSDPRVNKITIALAYIDKQGERVIELALDRGADIVLLMPRHPNVYQSCNSSTLASLMVYAEKSMGSLQVALHPEMLHAKALVANLDDGSTVGLVGSCNFKTRSFGQFAELCALFTNVQFNKSLEDAVQQMVAEADSIRTLSDLPDFFPFVAAVEQWLG